MQHASQEEDQEVKAGHRQRGAGHGVDGTQEEEGKDVLHVVNMSSGGEEEGDLVTAYDAVFLTLTHSNSGLCCFFCNFPGELVI